MPCLARKEWAQWECMGKDRMGQTMAGLGYEVVGNFGHPDGLRIWLRYCIDSLARFACIAFLDEGVISGMVNDAPCLIRLRG
jgi:hypothetical protein